MTKELHDYIIKNCKNKNIENIEIANEIYNLLGNDIENLSKKFKIFIKEDKKIGNALIHTTLIGILVKAFDSDFDNIYEILDNVKQCVVEIEKDFNQKS